MRAATPGTGPRHLVIVPTYNEALNLQPLVQRLLRVTPPCDVLVVDDGSPDGTGELAEALARRTGDRVRVLHRTGKGGRGGAVLDGLRAGVAAGYDWFVEMDADLSHQPEDLPRLVEATEHADVVIGSRYTPGGRIVGWGTGRKLWSRLSNRIIRTALGLPISDCTNGFRVYSRRAAEALVSAPLRERGFIGLSESALTLIRGGFGVAEVPTLFINRVSGTSNMGPAEALDALRGVVRMRLGSRDTA